MNLSIQARLTLLVLGSVFLFGLVAGYASYRNALQETDEISDAQLAQFAHNLMVISTHVDADEEQAEPLPQQVHKYQQMLAFQVWRTDMPPPRLMLHSDNLTGMTFTQMPAEGYSNDRWQGQHWRYYRQRNEERGLDVLVGQSDATRVEMAQEIALHNLAPFLLGLPLLAFFAILAIRLGLRPLRELTGSLRQLTPEQLAPVTLRDVPKEIAPVLEALNGLLQRIARVMENERRFTADASHELRTPLAALQAQIQAAQLAPGETERSECLDKALRGAMRMAHLVEQLLLLSRLDEYSTQLSRESFDLATLTQESCAELGADAIAKNIEISFTHNEGDVTCGAPDLLRILLRNLLDNAIRYTPHSGQVAVTLRPGEARQAVLEIEDSGSGVDEEKLARLGERFNRLSPQAADGVGLGLSIVQRIAEIHHAQIVFGRSAMLGGLSVSIVFPPCDG